MATLAEQLESALEGTGSALSASNIEDMLSGTATSIKPGTVTPIASQQSNQQSWNDVFKKISEGIALKPGEGLPEVPKNIPASTFYRTATQSGKLPAGASQFFTKPLAPETPTTALTTTPTTTPTTATSTTSAQNVGRQLQEAFDLQGDGGQDPQDTSFDAAMEQYNQDQADRDSDLFDMGLSLDDYDMFADQTSIGEPGEGWGWSKNTETGGWTKKDSTESIGFFEEGRDDSSARIGYIHTGDDPYSRGDPETGTPEGSYEKYGKGDYDPHAYTRPTPRYSGSQKTDIHPAIHSIFQPGMYTSDMIQIFEEEKWGAGKHGTRTVAMDVAPPAYTPIDYSLFDKATNLVTTKFDKAWNTIQNPFADPKSTAQLSLSVAGFLGVPNTMPISMGLEVLNIMTSEGMGQIGRTGIDMDTYWNPGSTSLGPSTMTSVHGFNSKGVAVDINGKPVGEYNPHNPQRHGLQMFGLPTKAGIEAEKRAEERGDSKGGEPKGVDIGYDSTMDESAGGEPGGGVDATGTDPATGSDDTGPAF